MSVLGYSSKSNLSKNEKTEKEEENREKQIINLGDVEADVGGHGNGTGNVYDKLIVWKYQRIKQDVLKKQMLTLNKVK